MALFVSASFKLAGMVLTGVVLILGVSNVCLALNKLESRLFLLTLFIGRRLWQLKCAKRR